MALPSKEQLKKQFVDYIERSSTMISMCPVIYNVFSRLYKLIDTWTDTPTTDELVKQNIIACIVDYYNPVLSPTEREKIYLQFTEYHRDLKIGQLQERLSYFDMFFDLKDSYYDKDECIYRVPSPSYVKKFIV
jgi:hypothetical protein